MIKEVQGPSGNYETYANATEVVPEAVKTYDQAHALSKSDVYLAAVYGSNSLPQQFELGSGGYTSSMTSTPLRNRTGYNGPLLRALSYRVFVRVFTQTGTGMTDLVGRCCIHCHNAISSSKCNNNYLLT